MSQESSSHKSRKNKIVDFMRRRKILSLIIGVVVVLAIYFIVSALTAKPAGTTYITAQAQTGTVVASVTGTGQVSAKNQVEIKALSDATSFTAVDVTQGEHVTQGQTLGTLDETSALLGIEQAKAGVESAEANYQKVVEGATTSTLESAQNSVASAQANLDNAQQALVNTQTQQAQTVKDDFSNLLNAGLSAVPATSNSGSGTVTLSGSYATTTEGTITIEVEGDSFEATGLVNASGQLSATPIPLGSSGLFIQFSGSISNGDMWSIQIPNMAASNYLSAYNAYQSALQAQTQAIQNAQNAIATAQLSLQSAQDNQVSTEAPPDSADVMSAQAQVDTAKAQLQQAETTYDQNILTAPFDGVVAAVNVQVGSQGDSSDGDFVLITNNQIATISLNEVDAAKVQVGQTATLTFDALPGVTVAGTVYSIDTIGTVTQGVVTYNVYIGFDTMNSSVKPGMSVSAGIVTDVAQNVVTVPSTAVKTQGTTSYVEVMGSNGVPQDQAVQVGITDGTNTQIVSGLSAGATVVTRTVIATSSVAAAPTSALSGLTGGGALGGGGAARFAGGGGGGFAGGGGAAAAR